MFKSQKVTPKFTKSRRLKGRLRPVKRPTTKIIVESLVKYLSSRGGSRQSSVCLPGLSDDLLGKMISLLRTYVGPLRKHEGVLPLPLSSGVVYLH